VAAKAFEIASLSLPVGDAGGRGGSAFPRLLGRVAVLAFVLCGCLRVVGEHLLRGGHVLRVMGATDDVLGAGHLGPPDAPTALHVTVVMARVRSDWPSGPTSQVASGQPVVVIGGVAGTLQGWPLVLAATVIEVCADNAFPLTDIGRRLGRHEYELPGGARLRAVDAPPGTHGFRDLWRGAEPVDVDSGELQVASVLDLLRIADASDRRSARLDALAYQAVLDVQDARSKAPAPLCGRISDSEWGSRTPSRRA
jgi:hypothetical protein